MTNGVSNSPNPALEPAAAAGRPSEVAVEATKKALDQQQLEGREAVQVIEKAAPPEARPKEDRPARQGSVDRYV